MASIETLANNEIDTKDEGVEDVKNKEDEGVEDFANKGDEKAEDEGAEDVTLHILVVHSFWTGLEVDV